MSRTMKTIWLSLAVAIGGILPIGLFALELFPSAAVLASGAMPTQAMTMTEQWLALAIAVAIKPLYLLIALGAVIWLWRQQAPDLVALRWGLLIFWLGEIACAANYIFFGGESDLWEFLHNYGMAVGFSFTAYAVLEGVDTRILKYSAPKERCAALPLCQACIKYADTPCKLRQLFGVMFPALFCVAAIPLCAKLQVTAYHASVLGSMCVFAQPMSCQLFECRYCPLLAMGLLAASWLALQFKRENPVALAKILLAAAIGPMSFGLLRLFLFATFRDNLIWFDVWEEITELIFTAATAYLLWIFRRSLFAKPAQPALAA